MLVIDTLPTLACRTVPMDKREVQVFVRAGDRFVMVVDVICNVLVDAELFQPKSIWSFVNCSPTPLYIRFAEFVPQADVRSDVLL